MESGSGSAHIVPAGGRKFRGRRCAGTGLPPFDGYLLRVTGTGNSTVNAPGAPPAERDWTFATSPFWLFSHAFAASVIGLFLVLGVWQLDRLGERRETNALVEERIADTIELTAAPSGAAELDYRTATATVVYLDPDFVRIGNRSQGGAAGEHVVAIAELADGSAIAVNRGFVPINAEIDLQPVPTGPTEISGWLRATVERGRIGSTDLGTGRLLPRLDTERVSVRLDRPLPDVWFQIAPVERTGQATFPDPVSLPGLDEGPHRSYAVQWFIFATLGIGFYSALVLRRSRGDQRTDDVPDPIH